MTKEILPYGDCVTKFFDSVIVIKQLACILSRQVHKGFKIPLNIRGVICIFHRSQLYSCAGPRSQCCDVVLVEGGRINLGMSQGVGIPEWEIDGEGWG